MLFDVTAVLVASLALTGVTGGIDAPETGSVAAPSAIADAASSSTGGALSRAAEPARDSNASLPAPALPASAGVAQSAAVRVQLAPTRGQGSTFSGSAAAAVDSSLLPRLGGRALLDQLALLPSRQIAEFVASNPASIRALLLDPPSATAVSTWWKLTPPSSRSALVAGAPELVGNLDGLDPTVRDEANRDFLDQSILTAERELPSLGRAEKADAEQRLHMLKEIEESLVTSLNEPTRTLLSVDTAWPGRAAVVVGDLETADYVSYMVPGMFFTVDGQIVDWTVISQDLYDEQAQWVQRLGRDDPALTGASVAVVSWIGYQTPGVTDVVSLDLAQDGAKYIGSAVNGLDAARAGDEPYVTLMTHSYGSTATLMALQARQLSADALVIIGSPGSAAQSVRDIGMSRDDVFVGEAAWDPVVDSAFYGSDPGSDDFGATTMNVDGATDPITGTALSAASGHLGYFDAGTEAMRNMALVGLGRGDLVIGSETSDPGRQLANGR